jgi:membrane-associated phospholipid phosphatase
MNDPKNEPARRAMTHRRLPAQCLLALLAVLVASSARAQTAVLDYDLRVDIPVTAAAVTWILVAQLAKAPLAADPAHWCDCNSDGSDALNGFDRAARNALRWNDPSVANTLSDIIGYGVAPLAAFGSVALAASHDAALKNFPVDALIIAEAVALAEAAAEIVKPLAGRERPFVHYLPAEDKARTAHPLDNNTSFYSGHASWSFSLAAAAGTVATLRHYRLAPWVWVTGLALATFVSYSRIAADRHYLTDVLTGGAMGMAIGFAVPYFFHRSSESRAPKVALAALPKGAYLAVSWSD